MTKVANVWDRVNFISLKKILFVDRQNQIAMNLIMIIARY